MRNNKSFSVFSKICCVPTLIMCVGVLAIGIHGFVFKIGLKILASFLDLVGLLDSFERLLEFFSRLTQ
ncbi:MAG: hypothetical protein AAB491_01175 [Patescibacteria group bacterium]